MVGCPGDFSGTQKLLQGLPDVPNAHVLALWKCQVWCQKSICIQIRLAGTIFQPFVVCGMVCFPRAPGDVPVNCTHFVMWAMEGVGVNVLVISLSQPVVVGTGTDGVGGPTQSNSPAGDK